MARNRNIDKVKCLCVSDKDMADVMALVLRGGLYGTTAEMAAAQKFVDDNLRIVPDKALCGLIDEINKVLQPLNFNPDNTSKLVTVCTWVQDEQKRRRYTNGNK